MSQFNFGNLGPPLSGAQLVDDNLEPWRDAVHTLHSGTSRPSYAVAGMMWLDTTTNPWALKVFDGTDDISLGTINTSTNVYAPAFGAGSIVNADISASAAIALSKLATLSNNRAVVTNGSGNLAAATTTAAQIGYLSDVTSNIQAQLDGKLATGNYITALTGDGTATGPGSVSLTLATVNSNVGSFGSSTAIPNFTVNSKGLVTAAGTSAVVAPAGTLSGNTLASGVVNSSLTSVGTLTNLTVTNTISGSINGNAATATALATARTINGVSFNGTANITVTAAAGTLTGSTLASGVTGSSLTSVGNITSGTWNGTSIADNRIASSATWNAKISSNTSGITGADAITNMVSLTQSEYNAITPNSSTFYVITDA